MSQLRKRFSRDLSIRNYSPRTIHSYISAIERLSRFYQKCPSEISSEEIKEYLNHLHQKGNSWSTVNLAMSAYNRLFIDTLNQPDKVQQLKRLKRGAFLTSGIDLNQKNSPL